MTSVQCERRCIRFEFVWTHPVSNVYATMQKTIATTSQNQVWDARLKSKHDESHPKAAQSGVREKELPHETLSISAPNNSSVIILQLFICAVGRRSTSHERQIPSSTRVD